MKGKAYQSLGIEQRLGSFLQLCEDIQVWRSHPFESFRLSFHGWEFGKEGRGGKGGGQGLDSSFCICYLLLLDHLPNANAEDGLVYAKPMTLFFFFCI